MSRLPVYGELQRLPSRRHLRGKQLSQVSGAEMNYLCQTLSDSLAIVRKDLVR